MNCEQCAEMQEFYPYYTCEVCRSPYDSNPIEQDNDE